MDLIRIRAQIVRVLGKNADHILQPLLLEMQTTPSTTFVDP